MVNPHNDDPPYEISGNGIPITGNNPIVIPILTAKWKNNMDATAYPYIRLNFDRCRSARIIIRIIKPIIKTITRVLPTKPHSSPTVQKIKSVLCSGTNLNLVCVPFKNPLPANPPEPMAILD